MLDAELWAVLEALDIARKETLNAKNAPTTIFFDSQKAIKAIEHPFIYQGNPFLRNSIYQKAKELQHNGHPMDTKPFRSSWKREGRSHRQSTSWNRWETTWALEFTCIYQEKLDYSTLQRNH